MNNVAEATRTPRSSPQLKALEEKIDELPLLPQVLVRVLQLDTDSEDFFDQFERITREDPGLAVKLIALANSAISSPINQISNIRNAMTRLGAKMVTGLVTSLAVQRVFMPSLPHQVRLWQHSIIVAVLAEQIAIMLPKLKVDPGNAYLIGLLHDIGRFVMFEHASDKLQAVDSLEWDSPEGLIDADMEVFRFTHCELGYLACKHWKLPSDVADAVRAHHETIKALEAGGISAILLCNQIADRLAIALIEDSDLADAEITEIESVIEGKCISPLRIGKLLTAATLASQAEDLRNRCDQLLTGLGFPLSH